jgi:hypothetical protein
LRHNAFLSTHSAYLGFVEIASRRTIRDPGTVVQEVLVTKRHGVARPGRKTVVDPTGGIRMSERGYKRRKLLIDKSQYRLLGVYLLHFIAVLVIVFSAFVFVFTLALHVGHFHAARGSLDIRHAQDRGSAISDP